MESSDSLKFVVNRNGPRFLMPWNYIGKGTEAKVYRKGEDAYKYYRFFYFCDIFSCSSARLDLNDVHYLQDIVTERILLPNQPMYSVFGRFKGYTTTYIEDLGIIHYMNLPIDLILHDFHLLTKDCRTLGDKHVLVRDLKTNSDFFYNHSFHYGLYFIDPGRYKINFSLPAEEVFSRNQRVIDDFLFFQVLNPYANYQLQNYDFSRLYSIKRDAEDQNIPFLQYIENDIKENSLHEYVKRKLL